MNLSKFLNDLIDRIDLNIPMKVLDDSSIICFGDKPLVTEWRVCHNRVLFVKVCDHTSVIFCCVSFDPIGSSS